MKVSIFVFVATFLVLTNAATRSFKQVNDECMLQNAIKPVALCFTIKLGIQNENGDINKEALRASLLKTVQMNAESIDKIVNECGDRQGDTAGEAAEALGQCIRNKVGDRAPR
ncbi:uncharacterized protein isoform X2 [Leptinotarsa decemlineata]|uniref:uncharacterized protein isoform X2 n=1 Tax=Leptinotarsa decemlineata TaxID=7539 RepID=UPI003D304799